MMPGMITLWSGAIADVPAGWHLCDGTEETPDLRDRFIVGSGNTYAVNDTGGAVNHMHYWPEGTDIAAGLGYSKNLPYVNHLPPYYALCYIMKL